MKQLLSDIYNVFLLIINNENYINVISTVVVAFTSYHVAQYNASKPEKLKVKQQQFKKVYLPLFRILSELPEEPTQQQAREVYEEISNILDKQYELAFPQLHRQNNELRAIIAYNGNPKNILSIMKHQVEVDYELLKKRLGYPSENFFNIFIRMTFRQKADFFVSWYSFLSFIGIIAALVVSLNSYLEHAIIIIPLFLTLFFVNLFVSIKLSNWVKTLKY